MVSSRGNTWGPTKFSIEFGQWNPSLKHSLKPNPSSPFPQILPSQSPALLLIWLNITHQMLYLPKVIQPVFLPIYPPTGYTSCKHMCLVVSVVSNSSRSPGLYSPPGSSVHGIFLARIPELVAISSSRESSQPRDWLNLCLLHLLHLQADSYHCTT